MTKFNAIAHPDDMRCQLESSGWITWRWHLIRWLKSTAVCRPDDIPYHRVSFGRLSWGLYLIRMSYGEFIISSECHTLPVLSHLHEIMSIANFHNSRWPFSTSIIILMHNLILLYSKAYMTFPGISCIVSTNKCNIIAYLIRLDPDAYIIFTDVLCIVCNTWYAVIFHEILWKTSFGFEKWFKITNGQNNL